MKFPEKYTAKSSTLHIASLNGGLNSSLSPYESEKENLSDCKNVWVKNGLISTRPALQTNTRSLIYDNQYYSAFYHRYKTADIEVMLDGEPMKIVVEEIDYSESNYFYLTHFMHWDGSLYKTARMHFARSSSNAFYIPDRIVFYKGKPIDGGGIFALVHLVNIENYQQSENRIYEIDSSFSEWNRTVSSYTPTVYINGRGNNYETAEKTGQAFTGTPIKPESLNILNDTFFAYYSSDGCSSSFRLPFSNLNPNGIVAKFYLSVSQYVEWIIAAGQTSATATLNKSTITMTVDYQKGIISFSKDSAAYELPLISNRNENNLRILAYKSTQYSPDDIFYSTQAKNVRSKILIAAKNRVFAADYNRPLYFSAESVAVVGDENNSLVCMAEIGNNIALFEKDKTYLLSINGGTAISSTSLLAESDTVFYKSNKLSVKQLSSTVGCSEKDSVVIDTGFVYWRANNGQFYTLSSAGKISEISENIHSILEESFNGDLKTIGAKYGDCLIFLSGNKALVLQKDKSEKPIWYFWEFPENLLFYCVFNGNQIPYFICNNTESELTFIVSLNEGQDRILSGSPFSPIVEEKNIPLLIKTTPLPLGCINSLKKINFIALRLKTKAARVCINNRLVADICRHNKTDVFETIKLSSGLCPIDTLELELTSKEPLELGAIDINFTELNLL